jgi:DNA-binding XRE family transcriptional regulator
MTSVNTSYTLIRRIGLAVGEARVEHGVSERELARFAGVSRGTVHRLERIGRCRPDLAVKVALAVVALDLYDAQPAPPALDDALAERVTSLPPTPIVVEGRAA